MKQLSFLFITLFATMIAAPTLSFGAVITGGTATYSYDDAKLQTAFALYGGLSPVMSFGPGTGAETATATEITNGIGGTLLLPNPVITHNVNVGPLTNPTGRNRQTSNADIDSNAIAATWGAGEQIGVDGAVLFLVGIGGVIYTADVSLTYSSSTGFLSINDTTFGVPNEAFRLENPVFTPTANGFDVSGTMVTGNAFFTGFGVAAGQEVGSFSMSAITAVPEPASMSLLAVAAVGIVYRRMRRKAQA